MSNRTIASAPPALSQPLLLTLRQLAAMLAVSTATVERMKCAGRLPRHVELSPGCHRWSRPLVEAWLAAGAPQPARDWKPRLSG